MLNKQKGNMYGFVTHTWNPIRGKCPHKCDYCYMKPFVKKELHFAEKELEIDLGDDNYIFIGSSTDMFAKEVPSDWILKVLDKCKSNQNNEYLFQTKNPKRLIDFIHSFPKLTILATTLESNRDYSISKAMTPYYRSLYMGIVSTYFKTMVSIEPIMDFDLKEFVWQIKQARPSFVSIGADSKGHKLKEPSADKIKLLIYEIEKFTTVHKKPNLKRLMI
jgi:protein gp37